MMSADELQAILARSMGQWSALSGKRLFVTGGTGFFGRWMLSLFVRINDALNCRTKVIVLTRDMSRARQRLGRLADHDSISFCEGNVIDFAEPNGRFDYVLHMAGEPHGPRYTTNPTDMSYDLVVGTRRVLQFAAATQAARCLFISSGAVYGPQTDREYIDEDTPQRSEPSASRRAYAEAKRIGEEIALESGVPTIIARPFAFIGAGLPLDASFAASQFLADGLAGRPIRVRNGNVVRSYLDAADLAEWLWAILMRGQPGRAYNVGSDRPTTLEKLAHAVADQCGVNVEIADESIAEHYVPSTTRANVELGLSQTVDLLTSVKRTVTWHREQAVATPGC